MQTVSALYTDILASGGHHEVKLEIDGVVYDMDKLISMQTSHALFDGAVSVGNTIAGTIDVQLIASSNSIPTMAELRPYVRAVDDTRQSEWLPRGVYWIDTREYDKETGILTLTGMDAMLKGEQDYCQYGDQGYWPQVDTNVLSDIAVRLGLGTDTYTVVQVVGDPNSLGLYELRNNEYVLTSDTSVVSGKTYYRRANTGVDSRTWPKLNSVYKIQYPGIGEGAYTVREVLGYIGSAYAGNWILNEQGKLRLIVLGDIPAETSYLIDEFGNTITLGGDRLVLV